MATRFTSDAAHSTIAFSVRHLLIARVRGRFTRFRGTIDLDPLELGRSRVTAEVEAASLATGDDRRDAHLHSAEFLEAARFPLLTFTSHEIERRTRYLLVSGPLTLHGISRDVSFEVHQLGAPAGRLAFSARSSIDRRDFGLVWDQVIATGGALVGDKVEIIVDIEAVVAAVGSTRELLSPECTP